MRLHALLLAGALVLLLPTAAAAPSAKVSISGVPNTNPAVDLTTDANKTLALTVHLKLSGFTCPQADSVKVTLTVNNTGNVTGKLDKTTLTYALPAVTDNPTGVGSDFEGDQSFNLSIARTALGGGNVTIAAAFDGKMPANCSGNPDPLTQSTGGDFGPSQDNKTLVVAYLGPSGPTPTPTATASASPTATATSSATPTASATASPTTSATEEPTSEPSGGKLLPAPGVLGLVGAVAVALLVLRKR